MRGPVDTLSKQTFRPLPVGLGFVTSVCLRLGLWRSFCVAYAGSRLLTMKPVTQSTRGHGCVSESRCDAFAEIDNFEDGHLSAAHERPSVNFTADLYS